MISLIDMDIVAYRCAASCEKKNKDGSLLSLESEDIALLRTDQLMREILEATQSEHYRGFISNPVNFRYEAYPEYKANRRDTVDPVHRQACKDYLFSEWNAESVEGYEADDLLAMYQTADSVICSIDKDLKQVAGNHYNFVKKEWDKVSTLQGLHNLYAQVLIGDRTDNLFGITGIGPVKANRYLEGSYSEQEMFDTVYELYEDKYQLIINLVCMWLARVEGETWVHHQKNSELIIPDELKPEVEAMLKSMKFFTKTT